MGYYLKAFIAEAELLQNLLGDQTGVIVPLAQNLALLPCPEGFLDQFTAGSDTSWIPLISSYSRLPEKLIQRAINASAIGKVAFVEAEYFGGTGEQGSIVWHEGQIILSPTRDEKRPANLADLRQKPINMALRLLGVQANENQDEFDTIGLGRHRHTEKWAGNLDY